MPISQSSAPLPKPIVTSYVRAETTPTFRLKFRKTSPLQNADAAERYENQSVMCEAGKSSAMYANKNDGKPWTESDLQDLKVSIEAGLTVAETATALSREGSIEDVLKTAKAHGWEFRRLSQFPDDRQERTRGPK
jgi:hypothetical protein